MEHLEEIKRAVSNKQFFEPLGSEPLPFNKVERLEKTLKDTAKVPVFVRVDKYKEVLSHLQDLRSTINSLEGALEVRKSVHRINAESDEVIERALQRFSDSLSMFGKEFVAPEGHEERRGSADDAVGGTISQLGDEIEKLKTELDKMKL